MSFFPIALSACWLGVLTSISPCPLATNIAAVSFLSRQVKSSARVCVSGLAYTFGRSAAYLLLAVVLVSSLLSVPQTSHFLQKYLSRVIGPLLILVGMFLLELLTLPTFGVTTGDKWQKRTATLGGAGAALLGFVFALSFCPVSAALYFGGLLPLAAKHESRVILPVLYGLGTALPVLVFALLIALGARSVGVWFDRLSSLERWARWATGVVFILAGVYLTLVNVFGWSLR